MKNNISRVQYIYELYLQHPSVSLDSRQNVSGTIFFALKGDHHDGNAFARDALAKGAAYAVIDDAQYYQEGGRYLLVADTLQVLQELAKIHRANLHIPIIGVTGSNGKTTTKELIHAVLSQRYNCYATQGNLNNHIGVPINILSIQPSTEIAVLEMGANHVGEIAQLCELAKPTHGLITNIGNAHLAGFGDIEGVKRGKGELYAYLKKHKGVVFINSTDPTLMQMSKEFSTPIYYPQDQDFYPAKLIEAKPYVIYESDQGEVVTTHLIGKHYFYNISAALCIAKYFGVESHSANVAIQAYIPSNNRSQLVKKGSNIILLDAYNANPTSMQAALEAFHFLTASQKVVILGDMNELGEASISFHKRIVQLTTQQNYKEILLYGPYMKEVCSYNPQALYFKQIEELKDYIKNRKFTHTAILIKGSHSHRLERLVEYI
ncbi:MAG: UDP-N-acetylmuramoyl-tripeptide--D-alanyl-D-alanine ligase [Candidatus Amoebophilus sp. 36-38]|nr:MAG: UDP-N-acetylmuramoyl-tripeptide--D-alanyl-D-alanine ligase [Candidatus Amoebophilus sp. 36-38]